MRFPSWPFFSNHIFGDGADLGPYRTETELVVPAEFPANTPTTAQNNWAQRMKFRKAPWRFGVEVPYSYDVRPEINWGVVWDAFSNPKYSYDVVPTIYWGLLYEAYPESQYSYEVRPTISWLECENAHAESQYSYNVTPAIHWPVCTEVCEITNDYYAIFTLTGCGSCAHAEFAATMEYVGGTGEWCEWNAAFGGGWNVTMTIRANGNAVFGVGLTAGPVDCWRSSVISSFDYDGPNVFTYTSGQCSGPATITVTKV